MMNMKKNIIFSLLVAATFFVGCTKDDGLLPKEVAVDEVPQPSVVVNGGSPTIDLTNLAGFQGKFDVKLLYPSGIQPAKLDVVIRKNNVNTNIKLVQAGITTYPTTLTITAAQIVSLFGTAIVLGDNYDIGVDIYTTSGNKYEAFPVTGAAYGSTGVANQPGFSPTVRYSAVCAYNPSIYQGNFRVVTDEWADYSVGDIVVITQISATQFSFNYLAAGPIPIVVTVNPLTNATSVAKQVYGTGGYPPGWTFGPISCESVASADNFALPCDQSFAVRLKHTVAAGSFGDATIRLKKQ
jgi:hypothetical protein